MKISIIVPCYNSEKYLAECIRSISAQTFPDFEVLAIDDGSTDHTYEIAERYCASDSRFRLYHQENAGVSAARNKGLDMAQGEWILFVDSDDSLPPDALEKLSNAADDETDLVLSCHTVFDGKGKNTVVKPDSVWAEHHGAAQREEIILRLIEGDSFLNVICSKLHRRAFLNEHSIRLRKGIKLAEDALFNLETVLDGARIRYLNQSTYFYRTVNESASHKEKVSEFASHLPWMKNLYGLLKEKHVLEQYWSAYVDTVVLRLYKDGGVYGVIRNFNFQAKPILGMDEIEENRLSVSFKILYRIILYGFYPLYYPFHWAVLTAKRKTQELIFLCRHRRDCVS